MGALLEPLRRLRSAFAVLALLAIALRGLTPSGFMVAPTQGGFPLVICTGHGPLDLSGKPDPIHGKKSPSDAPCAFSGHAAAGPPPAIVMSAAVGFIYLAPAVDRRGDLVPGRGLAAPPPPSQGPPRSV